jgi:hypothetical protein
MTSGFPPVLNVAHVAGADGRCARCKGPIGSYLQIEDADNGVPFLERPWAVGERVVEYLRPDGRSCFADQVAGYAVECQE